MPMAIIAPQALCLQVPIFALKSLMIFSFSFAISVDIDGKTPGACAFRLRDHDTQDAVAIGGLGLIGLYCRAQRHLAPKGTVGTLNRVMAVALELALDPLVALNGQRLFELATR